jgi:hypothetical protein
VKSNAAEGSGGGLPWLKLPKGIESYRPEKAGALRLDVVPYEVKSPSHPDRVEPQTLWYKYPFAVHYGVGVGNESVACPISVGKRCPLCERRAKLAKNWDENKEAVKALTPQKWVAYNIIDPDDSDGIRVFVFSRGKFAEFLEGELLEGDEENLNFYDVTSDGRTLKVRFSEDNFEGRKFLKATRIDFIPRPAMDEDLVLSKVACLDDILVIYDYEKIERLFSGDSVEEDGEEITVSSKSKRGSKVDEDVDDIEDDEDEDEEDDEDEDEDDEVVEDERSYGDYYGNGAPKGDDEEDEEDSEPEPVKSKKLSKPSAKAPASKAKKAAKVVEEDDDEEDDDPIVDDGDEDDDDDED